MDVYQKSLEILKKIVKNQKKFGYKIYLIGGWAVWAYNPYMKSRDIDLIIKRRDSWKLCNFLVELGFKETARVLEKSFLMLWNDDRIEIDVYDKRISGFKVDDLIKNSTLRKIDNQGVSVLSLTDLFSIKSYTAIERLGSAKGEKDLSDLLALLDLYYEDIEFSRIKIDLKKLIKILFFDFRQASRIYPIPFERFQKIKSYLKELKLL